MKSPETSKLAGHGSAPWHPPIWLIEPRWCTSVNGARLMERAACPYPCQCAHVPVLCHGPRLAPRLATACKRLRRSPPCCCSYINFGRGRALSTRLNTTGLLEAETARAHLRRDAAKFPWCIGSARTTLNGSIEWLAMPAFLARCSLGAPSPCHTGVGCAPSRGQQCQYVLSPSLFDTRWQ